MSVVRDFGIQPRSVCCVGLSGCLRGLVFGCIKQSFGAAYWPHHQGVNDALWIIYILMMGPTNHPETWINNQQMTLRKHPVKPTQYVSIMLNVLNNLLYCVIIYFAVT
jgi:hypothetical protein